MPNKVDFGRVCLQNVEWKNASGVRSIQMGTMIEQKEANVFLIIVNLGGNVKRRLVDVISGKKKCTMAETEDFLSKANLA